MSDQPTDFEFGLTFAFSRFGKHTDHDVIYNHTQMALMGEPLGFDTVWSVEHHFEDYSFDPDPLLWLAWIGSQTSRIKLGTSAIILPWHNPLRLAEQVLLLDNLSDGRVVFGMGRGLSRREYEPLGIPMGESRGRFNEMVPMLLEALETGYIEGSGPYYPQPRAHLRPGPIKSFHGRTYQVVGSKDSVPVAVENKSRLMNFAGSSPTRVGPYRAYAEAYEERWGERPLPIHLNAPLYCHKDAVVARERFLEYNLNTDKSGEYHYELRGSHLAKTKGYEDYGAASKMMADITVEQRSAMIAEQCFFGDPKEVLDRFVAAVDEVTTIGDFDLSLSPIHGGMPLDQARESLTLFSEEVMPKAREYANSKRKATVAA